jgi:hypothetical protein
MSRQKLQDALSYVPRGLRAERAAAYLGLGLTKFLEMAKDGRMPAGKLVDGCRIWDRLALDAAFDALPDDGADTAGEAAWKVVA